MKPHEIQVVIKSALHYAQIVNQEQLNIENKEFFLKERARIENLDPNKKISEIEKIPEKAIRIDEKFRFIQGASILKKKFLKSILEKQNKQKELKYSFLDKTNRGLKSFTESVILEIKA